MPSVHNLKNYRLTILCYLVVLFIPFYLNASKPETPKKEKTETESKSFKGDAYPLATCAVASKSKLGGMGEPIVIVHEKRQIKFCCAGCKPMFLKKPEKYLTKIDKKIITQQSEYYPLKTCLVSGDNLGESAVNHVHLNRLVRLKDSEALKDFNKTPEKFMKELDKAVIAKQKATYPLKKCLVMPDDDLDESAIDYVHANRLVRVCCRMCVSKFKKDPIKYLPKLDNKGKEAADSK